jgi:hypothetical protein
MRTEHADHPDNRIFSPQVRVDHHAVVYPQTFRRELGVGYRANTGHDQISRNMVTALGDRDRRTSGCIDDDLAQRNRNPQVHSRSAMKVSKPLRGRGGQCTFEDPALHLGHRCVDPVLERRGSDF